MMELTGNLWDYWLKPNNVVCITTNGYVKANGEAVMGRGVALQATKMVRNLRKTVGKLIQDNGHVVQYVDSLPLIIFPVKYHWKEMADLNLIRRSAWQLEKIALESPIYRFFLPRPGCGNGGRLWGEVRPLLADLPNNVYVINR